MGLFSQIDNASWNIRFQNPDMIFIVRFCGESKVPYILKFDNLFEQSGLLGEEERRGRRSDAVPDVSQSIHGRIPQHHIQLGNNKKNIKNWMEPYQRTPKEVARAVS